MKNSQMFKKPARLCLLFLYYPHLEDSKTVLIICQQKMPLFQQGQQFTLFKARKHFKCNHTTTGFLFQLNVRTAC